MKNAKKLLIQDDQLVEGLKKSQKLVRQVITLEKKDAFKLPDGIDESSLNSSFISYINDIRWIIQNTPPTKTDILEESLKPLRQLESFSSTIQSPKKINEELDDLDLFRKVENQLIRLQRQVEKGSTNNSKLSDTELKTFGKHLKTQRDFLHDRFKKIQDEVGTDNLIEALQEDIKGNLEKAKAFKDKLNSKDKEEAINLFNYLNLSHQDNRNQVEGIFKKLSSTKDLSLKWLKEFKGRSVFKNTLLLLLFAIPVILLIPSILLSYPKTEVQDLLKKWPDLVKFSGGIIAALLSIFGVIPNILKKAEKVLSYASQVKSYYDRAQSKLTQLENQATKEINLRIQQKQK